MATQAEIAAVQTLYVGYLGRAADKAGLDFWVNAVAAGTATLDSVATGFTLSDEYKAQYVGLSNADFVEKVYNNLLSRPSDPAGKAFWVTALEDGTVTTDSFISVLVQSLGTQDQATVANKVYVAQTYTDTAGAEYSPETAASVIAEVTSDPATVIDALDSITEGNGQTLVLTEDIDVIAGTANDDTILGQQDTADPADQIDGGEGTDTLELYNVTSAAVPNNVTNVERLNVIGANATSTAVNVDAGSYQQVWAEDGASVAVANLSNTQTIGIDGAATITGTFTGNTANVALNDADGTVTVDGASVRTVNVSGNTASGAGVTLAGATAATTLNVAAIADIALTATAAAALTTVNVTGEGSAALTGLANTVTTLDASANTGGVTATVANASVDVTGGAGADDITVTAALNGSASVNLGAGDDTLTVTDGGSIGNTTPVNGGAGTDTIGANAVNAGNAAQFQGFEHLGLNLPTGTLDLNLLTASNIQELELLAGGGTYTNVNLDQGLQVGTSVTGETTLTFEGATGADDSYTVTFNASNAAAPTAANTLAGTIVLNAVEDINIVSGGTNAWNAITLSDNAAETVTVTGAANLDLGFAADFGNDTAGTEVTSINASAATGDVSVNLANVKADAAGLTVTGGAGDDTFTTADFAVTLTGGAGDDTFAVAANTIGTDAIVTITDFQIGDVIDFGVAGSFQSADVSSATTLNDAFGMADDVAGVSWFQYGNSTYVVAAGTTTNAIMDDAIVQLTGQVDLSTATLTDGQIALA